VITMWGDSSEVDTAILSSPWLLNFPVVLTRFLLVLNCHRKLPGMGLRGTLGYNMNILTALVELLVKKKIMPLHGINICFYRRCFDRFFTSAPTVIWATIISEVVTSLIICLPILRYCKFWTYDHTGSSVIVFVFLILVLTKN
jgi:hypothetical protein